MSENESKQDVMPGFRDVEAWKNYQGPFCRWMHDTGVPALGACQSNIVECCHPECPIAQTLPNGVKISWKTRFCHPEACRYFEF